MDDVAASTFISDVTSGVLYCKHSYYNMSSGSNKKNC